MLGARAIKRKPDQILLKLHCIFSKHSSQSIYRHVFPQARTKHKTYGTTSTTEEILVNMTIVTAPTLLFNLCGVHDLA